MQKGQYSGVFTGKTGTDKQQTQIDQCLPQLFGDLLDNVLDG
jgi:hypothetical protein